MKFSQKKKRKMKKIRQRRIRKSYGYVIGMSIRHYLCVNLPEDIYGYLRIIDQTTINGDLYFLVSYNTEEAEKFFILKAVEHSQYICVLAKNLIKYKRHFQNPVHWQEKSDVYISEYGVVSVE